MAIVIDAIDLTTRKVKLPSAAFLVDTNIVIDFKDPLGRSGVDRHYAKINSDVRQAILHFKSHHECFSTLSVVIEYYKYLQVNYYKLVMAKSGFNADDFKIQRSTNQMFISGWDLHLREFQKLFKKNFKLYNPEIDFYDLINTFDGKMVDFGDQVLYKYSLVDKTNFNCIFSRDKDFYNLPDDFYFVTTDKNIVALATNDGKLYSI